jgi:DNA-binding NarL/FixJ family response regulator
MGDVRVLIVDDHAPFQAATADLMEVAGGYEVIGLASSGEESLELTERGHPDLVLMDLRLPGIDGLSAARLLRRRANPPTVIIVSTDTSQEDAAALTGCGAFSVLNKADLDLDWLIDLRRRLAGLADRDDLEP